LIAIPSYIVPDEIIGLGTQNSIRRNLTLIVCPLCGKDFEVRDGKWVIVTLPSGKKLRIKLCEECAKEEELPLTFIPSCPAAPK